MRYLLGLGCVLALCLSAGLALNARAGSAPSSCPAYVGPEFDLNGDGAISSIDQGFLACAMLGQPEATWTPSPSTSPTPVIPSSTSTPLPITSTPSLTSTATISPSPTATATATPTSTATGVPTATNTPSSGTYRVADLLNDSIGNHDIDPCGVAGFDWENHGVVQSVGPGSRNTAGAWFAVQWDCGAQQAGITISLRNLRAYAWTGSAWVEYQRDVDWCNFIVPPSGPFGADCALGANPTWNMPNEHRSIHGATSFVTYPPGTQCLVTTGEAKQNAAGNVALHFGADWGNGGQTAGGAVVGRFRMLTTAYVFFGAASCPASTLNAHPPPGVSP